MQSIARDSDESSEEEFFDAQGKQAVSIAWGLFWDRQEELFKGVKPCHYTVPVTCPHTTTADSPGLGGRVQRMR